MPRRRTVISDEDDEDDDMLDVSDLQEKSESSGDDIEFSVMDGGDKGKGKGKEKGRGKESNQRGKLFMVAVESGLIPSKKASLTLIVVLLSLIARRGPSI